MSNKKLLKMCSWALGILVLLLALAVWVGQRFNKGSVTAYDLFPLLGLGAFSLMWTHYVLGSLRRRLGVSSGENKMYSHVSGWVVLALILLHPGILIYQLYKDGFGLPPKSYLTVYAETSMKVAIGIGTISLIIFLAFELKKKFAKKSWWRFIEYAQVVAMGLIFMHGLSLGRELGVLWYKLVWIFYGISLISAVVFNYWYDRHSNK